MTNTDSLSPLSSSSFRSPDLSSKNSPLVSTGGRAWSDLNVSGKMAVISAVALATLFIPPVVALMGLGSCVVVVVQLLSVPGILAATITALFFIAIQSKQPAKPLPTSPLPSLSPTTPEKRELSVDEMVTMCGVYLGKLTSWMHPSKPEDVAIIDEILNNNELFNCEGKRDLDRLYDFNSEFKRPQKLVGRLFQRLVERKDYEGLLKLQRLISNHHCCRMGTHNGFQAGRCGELYGKFMQLQDDDMIAFLLDHSMIHENCMIIRLNCRLDRPLPHDLKFTLNDFEFATFTDGCDKALEYKLAKLLLTLKFDERDRLTENSYGGLIRIFTENNDTENLALFKAKFTT